MGSQGTSGTTLTTGTAQEEEEERHKKRGLHQCANSLAHKKHFLTTGGSRKCKHRMGDVLPPVTIGVVVIIDLIFGVISTGRVFAPAPGHVVNSIMQTKRWSMSGTCTSRTFLPVLASEENTWDYCLWSPQERCANTDGSGLGAGAAKTGVSLSFDGTPRQFLHALALHEFRSSPHEDYFVWSSWSNGEKIPLLMTLALAFVAFAPTKAVARWVCPFWRLAYKICHTCPSPVTVDAKDMSYAGEPPSTVRARTGDRITPIARSVGFRAGGQNWVVRTISLVGFSA